MRVATIGKAVVIILITVLLVWHVRFLRSETRRRGITEISTAPKLRSLTHDLMFRDGALDHAITLTYAIDLGTDTVIKLAPEIRLTGGPVAFDVLDHDVPLTTQLVGNQTLITFAPPPPAFGAVRQITIAFSTAAPPLKYGWGYRARPLLWATTLAPPRVAAMIQAHVPQTVSASGWACTYGASEGRICALPLQGRRRPVAVPMEPSPDTTFRLVLAAALGTAISLVMYAIYRRWAVHADAMGLRDDIDIPTVDEFIAEYRRRPRQARDAAPADEIDPFEAVALVARGIIAVLGLIGSLFAVSHFGGGFFPIIGPLALAIWAVIAGTVITIAVGLDKPRPWIALGLLVVLGTVAAIPSAAWILPGLVPLLAASLMQLTAK